jgi:hypothetical protein
MANYELTQTQGKGIDEFILRGAFIWPDERIAEIYGVPIEFVQQRRQMLEPRSTIEQDVDPAGEQQIKRDLEAGRNYQEEPFDLRGMIGDALRNVVESGPSQKVRGLLEEIDWDTFGDKFKDVLFGMGVDFPLINPGTRTRKYGKRIPYPGEEEEFEEWRP